MRASKANSADLLSGSFRLDASFHANEGTNAFNLLHRWKSSNSLTRQLDTIGDVCLRDGIFIGGRAKRTYVDDPKHGIPFLSSSDMLLASVDGVKLISKKQPEVDSLLLHPSWTLISRSGTIGNTTYVRSDMDGLAGSEHIMRVVADTKKILPGYLYAILSSTIGVSMIRQGTFGAVIDTIEPKYIASLPIPRLNPIIEERIHLLIEQTAKLRASASNSIKHARKMIEEEVGFLNYSKSHDHAFTVDNEKLEFRQPFRLDSFYYSGYCSEALNTLSQYSGKIIRARDVGFHFYNPPLFKRQFADSGFPYMSGVDIYNLRPHTTRYLSKNQPDIDFYIVRNGTVLIQNAGQRYGLITTPIMVTRVLDGVAVTSDVIRINHKDLIENGYICALFSSGFGRRLALRYSYGTSIPRLDVPEFSNIKIPWPKEEIRRNIGQMVIDAYQQYDSANELEDQAQSILASGLELEE